MKEKRCIFKKLFLIAFGFVIFSLLIDIVFAQGAVGNPFSAISKVFTDLADGLAPFVEAVLGPTGAYTAGSTSISAGTILFAKLLFFIIILSIV